MAGGQRSDPDDAHLLTALRAGDEAAFVELVDMYGPALLRLALAHVSSRAVAEEVVQETWLAVLRGIDRFEGRSSLRTWITSILLNIARSRGERERRTLPISFLRRRREEGRAEPAVRLDRVQGRRDERPGWWAAPPDRWDEPDDHLPRVRGARDRLFRGKASRRRSGALRGPPRTLPGLPGVHGANARDAAGARPHPRGVAVGGRPRGAPACLPRLESRSLSGYFSGSEAEPVDEPFRLTFPLGVIGVGPRDLLGDPRRHETEQRGAFRNRGLDDSVP